jgi:uncharacterized protein YcbK (DUF882 family)
MTNLPFDLRARLDSQVFSRRHLANLPPLEVVHPETPFLARRGFLAAAGAALFVQQAQAAAGPLVFSPEDGRERLEERDTPLAGLKAGDAAARPSAKGARGEVSKDFWERPRELWLRRHKTKEEVRVVYWKDGALLSEGYWQACSLLRDRTANVMTAVDPVLLDVLRGIHGYYEAWNWRHPIVATSGFRTAKTNAALSKEGAAKNSMHLFGRAVDLFVPGIPPEHIARLGQYLQQGGVGFYPSRGFTHLDTGKLRSWRG